jgi:hypothetical protein
MADEVEKIIKSISLPMVLPEETFITFGKPRRIPDIEIIIFQLPPDLLSYLDLEATVLHNGRGGQNTFLMTLKDNSYLRIRIQNRSLVEIAKTHLRVGRAEKS